MSPLASVATYLAAAGTLLGGGALGLAVLLAPADGTSLKKEDPARTAERPAAKPVAKPKADGTAFRYGPDVNHGRSDTPVHAASQARRAAQAAPAAARKNVSIRSIGQAARSSMAMSAEPSAPSARYAPSVPSSGH
jgi:hypothetical protein